MATKWAVFVNEQDSSEVYTNVLWELEAQHVPHPENQGEYCNVYAVTLLEDDIPNHVQAYIEITERKFDSDRMVEFWQNYVD